MTSKVMLSCVGGVLATLTVGAAEAEPQKVTSATGSAKYSVATVSTLPKIVFSEDSGQFVFTGEGQSIHSKIERSKFRAQTDVETAYGNAYQAPAVISSSSTTHDQALNLSLDVGTSGEITYHVEIISGGLIRPFVPIMLDALLKTEVAGDGSSVWGKGITEADASLSIKYYDANNSDRLTSMTWRSCTALNITRCPAAYRESQVEVDGAVLKTSPGRSFDVTIKTSALSNLAYAAPSGNYFQLHQNASAYAFVDPFFYIDPEWLKDNPGYSLVFSPGIENRLAVPEPRTWGLFILGFGVAGASLRRRSWRAL